MELSRIKEHWKSLAERYGEEIFATTKNESIKKLEINALAQYILKLPEKGLNILEIGCGNGRNCIELASEFRQHNFWGIDYIKEMIDSALLSQKKLGCKNICFDVGDVLQLNQQKNLLAKYDVIFTVRCLINLNTFDLQCNAIKKIENKIRDEGYFLMLENSKNSHVAQNILRESINLPSREIPPYNLFFDEQKIIEFIQQNTQLQLEDINRFASLHDFILYILLPSLNNQEICYDSPVIKMLTNLLIRNPEETYNKFGDFGQNKLFIFKKIKRK